MYFLLFAKKTNIFVYFAIWNFEDSLMESTDCTLVKIKSCSNRIALMQKISSTLFDVKKYNMF